jgi:uncharacterized protein (TIGR02001 family)
VVARNRRAGQSVARTPPGSGGTGGCVKRNFLIASVAGCAFFAPAPAAAQIGLGGGFTLSGNATAVTDYRFRGLSQSNEDPALQGSVTLEHRSGLFAGVFASTLSDELRPGEIELDGFVGYSREIASGTQAEAGVQFYGFPNNVSLTDASYFEPYAAVRHTLGPVTAEVGAAYAWEQAGLAYNDSLYVYGDLRGGIPATPVTITARVGYTSGPARFSPIADYLDWRIGAQYRRGPITFAVDYVDTDAPNLRNADSAVVGSLRFSF